MKVYVKALTLILSILFAIVLDVTLINVAYNESFQLLIYDLKSGFTDNILYIVTFVFLIVFLFLGCVFYWQLLFGRIHVIWTINLKNKVFIAVLNEKDIEGNHADQVIDLKHIVNVAFIAIIVVCIYINGHVFYRNLPEATWKQTKMIGHSFGSVNNDVYTGSLEAFEYNYELGRRTMEVDLILTTDNKLVLKHDWDTPAQEGISEAEPPTEEKFLNTMLLGKYTPLSFVQLCEIMQKYPDLWIVTDTKSTETEEIEKQFEVMIHTVQQLGCEEILDRMIVQVYNEEMYEAVTKIYHFNNYIFTMYWRFYDDDWLGAAKEVCRFCVNNGIETITIGTNRISPEMKAIVDRYERNVYVHTVNDIEGADKYLKMGVTGIYTDIIIDEDL